MAKKKKNDQEKMENFFDVAIRNYRTVPGIRILTKLLLPLVFCIIIIAVVGFSGSAFDENPKNTTNPNPESQTNEKLSYKELLDNIYLKDNEFSINIKNDSSEYLLNLKSENNILSGTIESIDGIHNLKIENDVVYEIKMNVESENSELLSTFNLDYIIPSKLVKYIENNTASTKSVVDGNIQYNYEVEDVKMNILTSENKILNVKIQNELSIYTIQYK